MQINIFGVGRSGTKAVQLYAAYLAVMKWGSVKINYEPFYWKNRYLDMSYRGIECHNALPIFADRNEHTAYRHEHYLENLNDYPVTVSKFIRGNGRISMINRITSPQHSIVVVRDLFDILNSIGQRQWDFLGKGLYYNDRERFMNEIIEKHIVDREVLKDISSNTDINALYWYAMNKYALEHKEKNTAYILFSDQSAIKRTIEGIYNIRMDLSLNDVRFEGHNLHKQYPLTSRRKQNNILYERINRQIIKRIGFSFDTYRSGTVDSLAPLRNESVNAKRRSPDIHIEKKSLYEYFNNSIIKKLNKFNSN